MVNKLKYLIFTLVVILSITVINVRAYNFDNTLKVYDYAQVLTDKEENTLKDRVNKYINKYNIDMVIVFVKYYDYNDLSIYANKFYTINEFGLYSDSKGIILVIDAKNRNAHIKTFGNISNLYTSDEIQSISDLVNKKNEYYNQAITFIEYSDKYASSDKSVAIRNSTKLLSINWFMVIIPPLLIPTLVIIIILSKNKKIINNKNNYTNVESTVINKRQDKFITTNTKQLIRSEK